MKMKYINAITHDLIDQLDFMPMREDGGGYIVQDAYRLFEKRDLVTYSIIEMMDADVLPVENIQKHIIDNMQWAEQIYTQEDLDEMTFVNVFVFTGTPSPELLRAIQQTGLQGAEREKGFVKVIVEVNNKRIYTVSPWPVSMGEVETLLETRLEDDLEEFKQLKDVDEIIHRQDPEPTIEEVTQKTPATFTLASINGLVWMIGQAMLLIYQEDYLRTAGLKVADLIAQGEYWRLITPMFLHLNFMHLATNTLSLLLFGSVIERIFGTKKFIIIYFISGILGNIASFAFTPAPSLGASGAILGVGGAVIYTWSKNRRAFAGAKRKYLPLVFFAFLNVFYGFSQPHIDNFAHLGGAVGGFFTAGVVCLPGKLAKKEDRRLLLITMVILAVVGFLVGLINA